MNMIDRNLPDRGLSRYFEKEMAEFNEVASLSSKDEYAWGILADWHSSCDFETKEEMEFLKRHGFHWSDFVDKYDKHYYEDKLFYESILQEV